VAANYSLSATLCSHAIGQCGNEVVQARRDDTFVDHTECLFFDGLGVVTKSKTGLFKLKLHVSAR
jgi:hypothetical protein